MGRYALILVAGFAMIIGLLKFSFERQERKLSQLTSEHYEGNIARYSAHSGAQLALEHLRQDLDWRDGFANLNIAGAQVDVRIYDSSTDSALGEDTIRIESVGSFQKMDAAISMKAILGHPDFPANVDAGITARANIGTLGNMNVDGRDHDENGNLISDNGVQAITTTQTYVCGGSTSLSGTTEAGTDFGPVRSGYDSIVEEHYIWPGSFPATPEDVLGGAAAGLPPNMLKIAAMSGMGGSQYVSDPASLHYPLGGITYVELPSGGTWQSMDFGASSGILIVHNSYGNALISNMNGGSFKGLIIADDMLHIHNTIIGGIFLMSSSPREGNCIGNGSGSLLFSRGTILEGLEEASLGLTNISILDCWE